MCVLEVISSRVSVTEDTVTIVILIISFINMRLFYIDKMLINPALLKHATLTAWSNASQL